MSVVVVVVVAAAAVVVVASTLRGMDELSYKINCPKATKYTYLAFRPTKIHKIFSFFLLSCIVVFVISLYSYS